MGLRMMVSRAIPIVNERPPKKRRPILAGTACPARPSLTVFPARPALIAILPHPSLGETKCDRRPW
jgi:hypothetical protein